MCHSPFRLVTSMVKRDGPGIGCPSFMRVNVWRKPGDNNSVVAEHDGMPLLDRIFVAAVFYKREVFSDGLSPYGYYGTNGSE